MGKGRKKDVVAAIQQGNRNAEAAVDKKKGCNCPIGCVEGEIIPAGAHKLPDGAVKTVCSNANCTAVPYQHAACFEKWEEFLANSVKRQQGCYRQLTKAAIIRELWDRRMEPMIVKLSTCPTCGGHMRRVVQDERAELVWRQAAQVARNPQPPQRNRNRAPPHAAAAQPHAAKPPAPDKGSMRVKTVDRPKAFVPHDAPQRAVGYASMFPSSMYDSTEYSYSRVPPVGASGWLEARQPERKAPPAVRVDTNDLREFPTLSDDVWNPVPHGTVVERRVQSDGPSSGMQHPPSSARDVVDQNNLTAAQLIRELEDAVEAFSDELWTEHDVVQDLLARLHVSVMEEVVDGGGLEQWLGANSTTLVVRKGCIVAKSDAVPAQLKSFGNVIRVFNDTGKLGVIFAETFDVNVFFDVVECSTDGCTAYLVDDIVSFKAEKVSEGAWHGCKWQAVFVELIQREEHSTVATGMKQYEAQCYQRSPTAAVESPSCMKHSFSESSASVGNSSGRRSSEPVPFDIESVIRKTPYLQMRPTTSAATTKMQSSGGAFRRIPMATVTPDDFHPSAASSPGPLQTSSPLLPDEDEQPTLKYDADVDGRNCATPLSLSADKAVLESAPTVANGMQLDAWLVFDKFAEDDDSYAVCSKEIRELSRMLN